MTRNKLLIGFALLLAVFLSGFVPQYLELGRVRAELESARQAGVLAEVRDLAGYLALETSQKNYGTAASHATRFFDRAKQVHDTTADPRIKQTLAEVLASRDQVTAGLAKGDPAVLAPVQELFRKVQAGAR